MSAPSHDAGGGTPPVTPSLSPSEARRVLDAPGARVIDVRTPEEFAVEGHIAGARLVPVQELALRFGELDPPAGGEPVLVVCEHGVRSLWATEFLLARGWSGARNVRGGMSVWPYERSRGLTDEEEDQPGMPSAWLVKNLPRVPWGRALDVACGQGRNALLLARLGWDVTAVDRDETALARLDALASAHRVRVRTVARDLETGLEGLGDGFDLVIVFRYLHRPLFPQLHAALRPGGVAVCETFTTGQRAFGKPSNPDFLLEPGELRRAFEGFDILAEREETVAGRRAVAGIVARRPGAPAARAV